MDEQVRIRKAVMRFIKKDLELLTSSAHEQTISHRIGVYLESIYALQKLNIDCEYNKHLGKPKEIDLGDIDQTMFGSCKCASCKKILAGNSHKISEKSFRPDIVVHSRGNDERNLIAIEVKKNKECPFDEVKLRALTKLGDARGEYGYELGVFIWFIKNEPQYKWFVGGTQV